MVLKRCLFDFVFYFSSFLRKKAFCFYSSFCWRTRGGRIIADFSEKAPIWGSGNGNSSVWEASPEWPSRVQQNCSRKAAQKPTFRHSGVDPGVGGGGVICCLNFEKAIFFGWKGQLFTVFQRNKQPESSFSGPFWRGGKGRKWRIFGQLRHFCVLLAPEPDQCAPGESTKKFSGSLQHFGRLKARKRPLFSEKISEFREF